MLVDVVWRVFAVSDLCSRQNCPTIIATETSISAFDVVRSKDTETIAWIKKGAQQGNVLAQFNLGGAYLKGKGVSWDTIEAYKWLFLAADNGHNDARAICNALAKKMDAGAVVKAQELANNWQVDFSKTSKWRR